MSTSPLHQLTVVGQSPWLDSITREWLDDGSLARWVDELSVRGVTSNPSIFAAALASSAYDEAIAGMIAEGLDDAAIFERIEVDDLQRACDALSPVYESSDESDGFVSIELEPELAHDAAASVSRARHLWAAVSRPNLMIKVPATDAGIDVIKRLLTEGINVNVTLLFGLGMDRRVMDAYLAALRYRRETGASLRVHSVASFFVSRVDTAVDQQLPESSGLRGTAAIANARCAWQAWSAVFAGDEWNDLERHGAQVQRPLWASTGTKNPAYSDVLYVDELIAPNTVNTMPMSTMRAFEDHGQASVTITAESAAAAADTLSQLASHGIDLDAITDQLLVDGLAAFQASYEQLLGSIAERRQSLAHN